MTENTTRMQQIYDRAVEEAQAGRWSFKTKLYNGEVKKLIRREGLDITLSGRSSLTNNLFEAEISWKSAFHGQLMSMEQEAYANAETDVVPKTACLAERLYLETKRATSKRAI